jgi:hypothetical protein
LHGIVVEEVVRDLDDADPRVVEEAHGAEQEVPCGMKSASSTMKNSAVVRAMAALRLPALAWRLSGRVR